MTVLIPTPLRSYTQQRASVDAEGTTLAEVLHDLDRRYPGIRFRMIDEQDRIRQHIRIFINREPACDLSMPLRPGDEMQILQALSGG
ncbi:MAG TPA: MoaD/ThiS family protein [Candidatus Binatia bacterium]|nr:MoaD/ThiS family protein [Candidatus Binatia bacterium]